jgi:integrase/recombinase XerD
MHGQHLSPHSLRHAFVTACLDAGVPLRAVQIAARHSDPRMTRRYDRARGNLDRHANYIMVGFIDWSAETSSQRGRGRDPADRPRWP